MKTIGVDIRVLTSRRMSGIEEYTDQLLAHLIPLDTSVRYRLYSSGRQRPHIRPWMQAPHVEWVHDDVSNRLQFARTWLTGRPHLDQRLGGVDGMFFPHFLLGATSPNVPRVMTWHDLSYERMPETLSWRRRLWHSVQMRARAQAQSAHRIIAVSGATRDDLVSEYGIARDRITVIHSGIDPELRRASEAVIAPWRVQRGLEAPYIVALGTREPRKNLPALVRAWDAARRIPSLRGIHLVIAGQRGWGEGALRRAVRSVHAPRDVHFIDDLQRFERSLLLSAASALVYPSLMEGFGFPPLEAMACGTPVIVSATSALVEVVGDAGLLVDPYHIDDIALALTSVLTDAGLRSRLISRGYERAGVFSWKTTAQETLDTLHSVFG